MTAEIIDGKAFAAGAARPGRGAGRGSEGGARRHAGAGGGAGRRGPGEPGLRAQQGAGRPSRPAWRSERAPARRRRTEAELLALVDRLNRDPAVHGILVQLPLPPQIDAGAGASTRSRRRRTSTASTAERRAARDRAGGAGALHAARRLMLLRDRLGRPRGARGGGGRALEHRRQADGAAAAARELHGDGRHSRTRDLRRSAAAPTSWWRRSAGRRW